MNGVVTYNFSCRKCPEFTRLDESRFSELETSVVQSRKGCLPVEENCKKASCKHVLVLGKHYSQALWSQYAQQISKAQPIYQVHDKNNTINNK